MTMPSQDIALDDPGFEFFRGQGVRDLLYSLAYQSIQDLCALRAQKTGSREKEISAGWLNTPSGHDCVAFLMPEVSADVAIARIYKNPEAVLQALAEQKPKFGTVESAGGEFMVGGDINVGLVGDSADAAELLSAPSFA